MGRGDRAALSYLWQQPRVYARDGYGWKIAKHTICAQHDDGRVL
jgi:hypothetical protein